MIDWHAPNYIDLPDLRMAVFEAGTPRDNARQLFCVTAGRNWPIAGGILLPRWSPPDFMCWCRSNAAMAIPARRSVMRATKPASRFMTCHIYAAT